MENFIRKFITILECFTHSFIVSKNNNFAGVPAPVEKDTGGGSEKITPPPRSAGSSKVLRGNF